MIIVSVRVLYAPFISLYRYICLKSFLVGGGGGPKVIIVSVRVLYTGFSGFRFLGFQVFGFSGFQVFWFRFFGRDRTQGFRTGWVKMGRRARQYYSNSLKYSKIQIYSNKFTQNCKFSGSLNFYKTCKHILIENNFAHIGSHQ